MMFVPASDSEPKGSTSWVEHTIGALTKVVFSEHIDQLWGIHHGPNGIWYKAEVTSTTPQGSINLL